jgi:hypothetical protein
MIDKEQGSCGGHARTCIELARVNSRTLMGHITTTPRLSLAWRGFDLEHSTTT